MAYDGKLLRLAQLEYEKDKDRREADFQQRRERVYQRQPRLRVIESRLSSTTSRIIAGALRQGTDPAAAIALAESLRKEGLRVQLYGEQKKFKQKMAYADKLGVPFAVLLGEDEIAEGVCSVKNMQTGDQQKLTAEAAAEYIRDALAANDGPIILE